MKSINLPLLRVVLCLLGPAFIVPAGAATIAWTNTSGGSWNVAANWRPNSIPGAADDVFITSNGTYTVTMDVSPTISSLTLGGANGQQTLTNISQTLALAHASVVNSNGVLGLNGGSVNGAGTLTINGLLQWNGGSTGPGSSLVVMPNGVVNIESGTTFQGAVTNFGTVNWLAGSVGINTNSGTTGVFWNEAGALFDIQCSQNLVYGISLPTFHNAGLIRKELVAGSTSFGVFLNNSGTVQAKAGTLNFPYGTDLGGTFQADSGAAIVFTGGAYGLSSPPNFQGPGLVQMTGGTLTLNAFTGLFTLNGIGLDGQSTVSATGTILLNGSSLNAGASLTVLSNGVLNIQSATTFQGAVTNFGTVNWLGGNVGINTNSGTTGVFWNEAGALFDIQCSQNLVYGISLPTFHNAGLIRKSLDSGTTSIALRLENTGTVQAQIGVIGVQGPYAETPAATLAISLAGLAPGTGFGKIQFSAPPVFAGKFSLSTLHGYRPNLGDSFLVIGFPSFAGAFTSYSGLDLGGGIQLTPQLSASSLTLLAAVGLSLPNIASITLSGANVVLNCVNGQSGKTNTTLMSTNVTKPLIQWSPIATNVLSANGNFTIILTNTVNPTVPQRSFILKLQ